MILTLEIPQDLLELVLKQANMRGLTSEDYVLEVIKQEVERLDRPHPAMDFLNDMRTRVDSGGLKFTREEMNER